MAEKTRRVIPKTAGAGPCGAWSAGRPVTLPAEVATAMLKAGYATEIEPPEVAQPLAKRIVEQAKERTAAPKGTPAPDAKGESESESEKKEKGKKNAGSRKGLPPMPKFGK